MKSEINYFRFDSKNTFSIIDEDYKIKLTMQLNTTLSSTLEESIGKEINKFFNGIISKNEGDLFEINQAITSQIIDDKSLINTFDTISTSIDNILNTSYNDLQITFDQRTIEDISNILFFSFNKIKQYAKNYNIKTHADFKSSLYEINFHDVDIVKDYIIPTSKSESKSFIGRKGRSGSTRRKSLYKNTFLYSSSNLAQNKMHQQFSSFIQKDELDNSFSTATDNYNNQYKYFRSNTEIYPLPNELIILVNKFQYIRRLNFIIEMIDEDKLVSYIIILLNAQWLFPNMIEVEFDLTCDQISNGLDFFFKQQLIDKMKEINKILKTTMYDTYRIPSSLKRKKWDVNMSSSVSFQRTLSFLNNSSLFGANTNYNNNISNSTGDTSSLDDENFFTNSRNGISGLQIVKENLVKLDMIIIYSYFISKWENIKVLMLRFPDSFSREIEASLHEKNLVFLNMHFMNFFVDISQLIDLSVEFNSLDTHSFEKILGLIYNNKTLRIIRLNLFSRDRDYSPSGLFKLCYGMKIPVKKFFCNTKKDNMNSLCDDVDHIIIWRLLNNFQANLEFLFFLLQSKKHLTEFTLVLDLPPILFEEEPYLITMIKFIINFILIISFENHKFSVVKLIAPLLLFDTRKYPLINDFLNEIDETNQPNLEKITNLTIQLKFFCVEKITNIITPKITSLFLGDLDIDTFVSFAHYYSQESFTQKSMLITLKISLGYYIIDFKLMEKYLEMIYKAVPRYLSEHMLFSNLIVNKDNVNNIIKLINYNQVNKYLLEFNFKSSKDVYSSKINNFVYTQNRDYINKTRYLLKKIIHYNKGKEKKHKKLLFEYIISFTLQKKEIVLQTKDENE